MDEKQDSDILTYMEEQPIIRTTVYMTKHLHDQAKIMAILTNTNFSHLVRVAIAEKIKSLKEKGRKDD